MIVYAVGNMLCPSGQCLLLFACPVMSLVYARDTAFTPADVIKDGLCNFKSDAKFLQPRRDGSANVVNAPKCQNGVLLR